MISEAVRKEVMERDHGNCQFFHRQPVEATEVSHFDHQGIGGLPPDHWKNQAPNLASSCAECHRKIHLRYLWEAFAPSFGLSRHGVYLPSGCMVLRGPDGEQVQEEDLWFYVRHEAARLEKVEARIQGLAMIEGDVARDLYELSKGYKLLEPDAASFAQYIAGRNVSATKATQAARAYGWMEERGLEWPPGLTSEKADILRRTVGIDWGRGFEVQAWLAAAVDQSVSDLKQELIDAGLMKATVRWYVHIRAEIARRYTSNKENPVIDGQMVLMRTRSVDEALAFSPACMWDRRGGLTVITLRADKFVAGLNWDRKTKVLSDRDGNEVPYKDLTRREHNV